MRLRRRLALAATLVALLVLLLAIFWPRRTPLPREAGELALDREPPAALSLPSPVAPAVAVRVGPRAEEAPAPDARGAFEGRVVSSADGAGIPGAELTFSQGGAAASVRAGAGGAFRFVPPARGLWTLAAATAQGFLPFAPEWGTSPVLLDARPGAVVSGVEVALQPAIAYRGEVHDPDGRPVPGAEVRILGAAAGDATLLPLRERYRADAEGAFTFVAPDGARLEARADGFAPGRATLDREARTSRRVVIALGPGGAAQAALLSISGAVVRAGPGATPVAGAVVVAEARDAELPVGQAVADAAGRFTLRELPEGRYRLTASAPGLAPAARRGVQAGATDVVLALASGGAVAGQVRDRRTGAPVAPFVVTVQHREGPLRAVPMRTVAVIDAEGRFTVDGLAPGPALVVVASPRHAPSPGTAVTVPEGGAPAWVEVELTPGGEVTGTVVDRATRKPIAGAGVEAEGMSVEQVGVLPLKLEATTGEDGAFQLAGLPEARLSLFVRADGHHSRVLGGVTVRGGEVAGPLVVDLAPVDPGDTPKVELAGIGAVLDARGEGLRVRQVVPGGGAAEAGLVPGDEILRVDGRPVAELGFGAAIQAIRGPEGTQVLLLVRRSAGGQVSEVPVSVPRRLIRS
jgi:membrane-associated protease RseP (regulator of RpoE activity)